MLGVWPRRSTRALGEAAPGAADDEARSATRDRLHRAALGVRRLDHRLRLAVRRAGRARPAGPGRGHLLGASAPSRSCCSRSCTPSSARCTRSPAARRASRTTPSAAQSAPRSAGSRGCRRRPSPRSRSWPSSSTASTTTFASGWMKVTGGQNVLTATGIVVAVVLMALFTAVNFLSVRKLANTNSTATWWKVGIPVLTIVVLAITSFHGSQLHRRGRLQPERRRRRPRRGLDERDHLRPARLRAGRPARGREREPEARHPARGDRRDRHRRGDLHPAAGRLPRRAAVLADRQHLGRLPVHDRSAARSRTSPRWSASAGWRRSSTSTR